MNKKELVTAIAQRAGVTKDAAENSLDALVAIITEELTKRERLQIAGLGIFETRERAAHMGTNLHTGEKIEIGATTIPAFKPSKTLKDALKK